MPELLQRSTLMLRQASPDDAVDVLKWRNDSLTRSMSRNSAVIEREDHLKWFAAALRDPSKLLLVALVGQSKVGMIRFDELQKRVWEVNINLSPAHRGQGLGHAVLSAAIDAISARQPTKIVAEIKPTNEASRRLFEGRGFQQVASTEAVNIYEYTLES